MQKTLLWSPFITETRGKIVFPIRYLRIFAQMLMSEKLFFLWVKYWDILSRGKILKPWVGEELRKVGWGGVELEQRVVLWFGTDQSNRTNTLPGVFFYSSEFLWVKEEFSCVFVLITFAFSICCLCLRSWLNILRKLCWLVLTVFSILYYRRHLANASPAPPWGSFEYSFNACYWTRPPPSAQTSNYGINFQVNSALNLKNTDTAIWILEGTLSDAFAHATTDLID